MHFLILGASGASGQQIVEQTLARGTHSLTLYVRTPSKIPDNIANQPNVRIVQGDLHDRVAFKTCFVQDDGNPVGIDSVISALGPRRGQPSGNPITTGYEILLPLMHTYHVTRLVILSTVSVSSPKDHFSTVRETLVAGIKLIGYYAWTDVVATGELMRGPLASGIKVTLARVPTLTNGEGGTLKVNRSNSRYPEL